MHANCSQLMWNSENSLVSLHQLNVVMCNVSNSVKRFPFLWCCYSYFFLHLWKLFICPKIYVKLYFWSTFQCSTFLCSFNILCFYCTQFMGPMAVSYIKSSQQLNEPFRTGCQQEQCDNILSPLFPIAHFWELCYSDQCFVFVFSSRNKCDVDKYFSIESPNYWLFSLVVLVVPSSINDFRNQLTYFYTEVFSYFITIQFSSEYTHL